jgi:hypothetical protein
VGPAENVDRVELEQAQLADDLAEVPGIDAPGRARGREALRGQRDPARRGGGEAVCGGREGPGGGQGAGSGRDNPC